MAPTGRVLDRSFPWDGATVRWSRTGSGPPIVFCHGTPWSSHVWRTTADLMAETNTVYRWDMVGYGQSDMVEGDVSLAAQGRLLASLIDHWRIEPPTVIAHDIGGAVALRAHLLHGAPFRAIALVDVVALRPWGSPFFRLVADHPEVFSALPGNLHRALIREYIAGASHRGLTDETLEALVEPWLGSSGQAAFYRQIAQADEGFTAEFEPLLSTMAIPTLVVWGIEDTWIPKDRANRLTSMIKNSRSELIADAGHLIQEDAPTELNTALLAWLSELGANPSEPFEGR